MDFSSRNQEIKGNLGEVRFKFLECILAALPATRPFLRPFRRFQMKNTGANNFIKYPGSA
jgi:hypothetical protein